MTRPIELDLSLEEHEAAFREISFLLGMLARTIDDLMGGASAMVGRAAGQSMARKLPVNLVAPTLSDVLAALTKEMSRGFELTFSCDEEGAKLSFGLCAIREVCRRRGDQPGDMLCQLFHHYLAGLVGELLDARVSGRILERGSTCSARLEVQ